MPKVTFINKDNSKIQVEASNGISLLEVAHENNLDLEGSCEGSLACSTCHVVVEENWFSKLPKASEDEEDMLDMAFGLTKTSRLACQIIMNDELDGLIVSLPSGKRNL